MSHSNRAIVLITTLLIALNLCTAASSEAATYLYNGTVTGGSGGLVTVIPVGTPTSGFVEFDIAAVQAGFADEDGLSGFAINVGGLCVYLVTNDCSGTQLLVNIINEIAVSFDSNGNISGGITDVEFFSPSDPWVSWVMDFDSGTFALTDLGGFSGNLMGEAQLVRTVPVPAAFWLFVSGLLTFPSWPRSGES